MKHYKWLVLFLLMSSIGPTYLVWANDDDDHYEYEGYGRDVHERYDEEDEYEYEYEYEENDDDDEYEEEDGEENWQQDSVEFPSTTTWDVWSRTVDMNQGVLPFEIPDTMKIENQDGKQIDSYVMPTQGEMMVPAVETAELVGATVHYYPKTEIAEMSLDGYELIVRVGSNAVYENDKKTPMSVEAMMNQDKLYMPISVLTNGLGLTVTWNEAKQTFLVQ